jgi:hypothetical protein
VLLPIGCMQPDAYFSHFNEPQNHFACEFSPFGPNRLPSRCYSRNLRTLEKIWHDLTQTQFAARASGPYATPGLWPNRLPSRALAIRSSQLLTT